VSVRLSDDDASELLAVLVDYLNELPARIHLVILGSACQLLSTSMFASSLRRRRHASLPS
jgi:hypothetical protein